MMRKTMWLSMFVATSLLVVGCGKKEKSPTSPESETESAVPQVVIVKGPSSQNLPAVVASNIASLNALTALANNFVTAIQGSTPTKTGDTYVWNYTSAGANYTVTSTTSSEGASWQVKVTGVYDGKQVNDALVAKGFSSETGNNGWWEIYDPFTGQKEARYDWSTDANNVVHATLQVYDDPTLKYEVINNPDGSGSIVVYEGNVKRLEATWQASGSGTYKFYDDSGNVTGQGSWG